MQRREFVQGLGLVTVGAVLPACAGIRSEAAMRISGPIANSDAAGDPYRGANDQPVPGRGLPPPELQPFGYVEEEYFVSGVIDGRPYTTSLLVRKPRDPARFSGLVAVETLHFAGALPLWFFNDVWMRDGHAWAMIGSQRVALEGFIRPHNPERYASLNIPELETPTQNPGMPPSTQRGGVQDLYSQAILTQLGAMLKSNPADSPLRGLNVRKIVLGGSSQTGMTTLSYMQHSHAGARLADGKPIWDGYLPMQALPRGVLPPVNVPVMHPIAEGDLIVFGDMGDLTTLRSDSDSATDRYRHYQVSGAAHVISTGVQDPMRTFPMLTEGLGPNERITQFPSRAFFKMFVVNFVDWVMRDVAPPTAPRIELANGQIVRDQYGNARGGVRTPYLDVPRARYIASAPPAPSNPMRRLIGLQQDFPIDQLRRLYPSREEYLRRFNADMDDMIETRFVLREDGERLKADEAAALPL